jgi:hypothetical protein
VASKPLCLILAFVVFGCLLTTACGDVASLGADDDEGTESSDSGGETLRPNWHRDVAPIVHARCVSCHRDGGMAPFTLEDHATAAEWATPIVAAVTEGTMPPWGAHETPECQPEHGWVDDRRLSAAEIATLVDWEQLGAPEGNIEEASPLPPVDLPGLADPSAVFQPQDPIVVDGIFDSYTCTSIDLGLDQDAWITGAQVTVDNEKIVHHALVMLDETGASAELAGPDGRYPCDQSNVILGAIGSYFPGSGPTLFPEQLGVPVPAGARIILSFHYHPTGLGPELDQSSLALRWTTEPPAYDALVAFAGNSSNAAQGLLFGPNDPNNLPTFLVPAGAEDHPETMELIFPDWIPEVELFMVAPHMHNVGVDFRVTLEHQGQTRCVIQDPHWHPDWQMVYMIDSQIGEFPRVGPGDRLEMRCTYDNSLGNPTLVEALASLGLEQPIDVYLGDSGVNEMCMLIYGLAIPRDAPRVGTLDV